MTDIDYAERVQRGIALLDKKWPAWAQEIDLDRLDIEDGRRCMTAQYAQRHDFGKAWFDAIEALGLENEDEDYEAHGFNTPGGRSFAGEFDTLNGLWKAAIVARRAEVQPEANER